MSKVKFCNEVQFLNVLLGTETIEFAITETRFVMFSNNPAPVMLFCKLVIASARITVVTLEDFIYSNPTMPVKSA